MYYLLIITAVVMFSFQFILIDGFKKEEGCSVTAAVKFTLYSSIAGFVILLITNSFHLEISTFSIVTALIYSIVCTALNYYSIMAFVYANLSVYSVFSMIGGMILPFFYGILMCGEEFKWVRLLCCGLICLAIIMSISKENHSTKATKYYILVFILNGLVCIISKFHQSYPELCVDSGSFMILTRIISVPLCIILLLMQKKRSFSVSKKSLMYSGIYSILNGVGNLFVLISLLHIPASVQYPIVTGGVIVTSTLITIAKKEKITKNEIFAAFIAFISTILIAI